MRLSHLVGKQVVSQTGWRFGRVFDVRAQTDVEGDPLVLGLVIGTYGLSERLLGERLTGGQVLSPRPLIRWDDVVAVRGDIVVVRSDARESAGAKEEA